MNKNDTPFAWARKWHIEGEVPVKTKKENGRWHWGKFKFLPITPHKIFPDDVPLFVKGDD